MSLKSSTKIAANRYELEVEVDAERFEKAVEKAYRQNIKKMNVPGFRVGKAPRSVVEKLYGKECFYQDAVNGIYPEALSEAIEEADIETIRDNIEFDVISVGPEGLVFTATLTTKPDVEVEQYKGLEAERPMVRVTDEAVAQELSNIRERNARIITVEDRAAQMGDTAVFDFEGFFNGEPFEGGKAENYSLVLGSGNFVPGFEEQLVGHNAGEEFDITITFPEDYQAEHLAGQDTVFKIKLNEIKEKELPELDDEFAKDVSEFDTLDEYKQNIKETLEKNGVKKAEEVFIANIQSALIDKMDADIPDAMYMNRVDDLMSEMDMDLRQRGLSLDIYMKYTGMDVNSFRAQFQPRAERQVKLRLALEKVAELENIEVTEEELNKEYEGIAADYKMSVEDVKKAISEENLKKDIAIDKAMNLVKETAVEKVVEPEAENGENEDAAE